MVRWNDGMMETGAGEWRGTESLPFNRGENKMNCGNLFAWE
jgi:hypothetical protein